MASIPPQMPPMPPAVPVAAPVSTSDKAARLGLVLSLLLVLIGVVGAVAKSGDEATTSFSATGSSIPSVSEEDGDAPDDAAEPGAPAYVVPEGFEVVSGDGVHLAVPSGWLDVTGSGDLLTEDQLAAAFPDLDDDMRSAAVSMVNRGAKVVVVDPVTGYNLNVLTTPGAATLEMVRGPVEEQLEEVLGVVITSSDEIETPLGDALRIAYTIEVDGAPVEAVQFYVPVGGEMVIVTATGAVEVADQAIQTLRTGDAPVAS